MLDIEIIEKMTSFSRQCETADSVAALEDIIESAVKNIGAKMYAYHHLPPLGAWDSDAVIIKSHFGFPQSWVDYYIGCDFCNGDPLVRYGLQINQAFWWSDLLSKNPTSEAEVSFHSEIRKLDVSRGLALPVFGAKFRSGFFVIGFEDSDQELSTLQISMLQWACQLAHYRYVDLLGNETTLSVDLSKRESEVLKWVVKGKSNSEIANILRISRHTIDSYMRRLLLKLKVTERVSASLRGVALGLI